MTYTKLLHIRLISVSLVIFFLITFAVFSQDAESQRETYELFEGITYVRDERSILRPMVIHVMLIDLTADGIDFFVTPADDLEDYDYTARTTTQFVDDFGVQVAINGDFFGPVRDDGNETESGVNAHGLTILDNVTQTAGFASSELISTLYIDEQNHVTFSERPDEVNVAISGKYMLLIEGVYQDIEDPDNDFVESPHPRAAIGLSADGNTLILMVVDGRQSEISEGATLPEFAELLKEYGAYIAMNLDGGGSASMVIQNENHETQLLNSPVNYEQVGVERPVANHLGIYAEPLR